MAGDDICRQNAAVPQSVGVCPAPAALGSCTELYHTFGKQRPHDSTLLVEDTTRVYYAVVEPLLTPPRPLIL